MTKPLTEQELAEIKERAEKATEGPWKFVPIIDLREDIPKLIAEVERLRDLEEGLRLNIKIKQEGIDFLKQENERYREAIEKALNAEEQILEGYESE